MSGSDIESQLRARLGSKIGVPIDSVSCPDRDVADGETIDCDVTFGDGRTQTIAVTVSIAGNSFELTLNTK